MVRFPARALVFGTVGTLAAACAGRSVPVYVAPSNETIEAGTEMALSGDGQYVYIFNHASVAIMVTGLHLTDCENIKNRCEVMRLRVQIRPGQRENVATVRPDNPNRPSSFRFTYTWEPAH